MERKILTISIAAYNVGQYLEQTLDSLLVDEKYLSKLEIIVVNDGSKDDTADIAKIYEIKYPKIFKVINKENGGYGSTINTSIQMAQGKYFKQLDGDDWYQTKSLQLFIDYLDRCDSDLVISPFFKVFEDSNKRELVNIHNIANTKQDIENIKVETNLSMHELTIRTKLLKENNIRITENCFYTDNEYTLYPLLYAYTISKFSKPVYCYRLGRTGQSVSLEGAKKHYKDTIIVTENIFLHLKNKKDIFNSNKGKFFITVKLRNIVDMVYTYYLIMCGQNNTKQELYIFDKKMKKNYFMIYKISNSVKKIKILRITRFLMYDILANRECRKWK